MEFTISSVLSLFTLLALSAGVYYVARRLRLPYTVLLVAVGLLLVPLVQLPGLEHIFGFIDDLQLTPELLFYVFLPVLIFESGYAMSIRMMLESAWTVLLLSVVGLLISAFGVAGLLYLLLSLIGLDVPFVVLLLFGAIISATDPVAVLALFKDVGAPRRLSIVFEGESLFNDGTAVALFFVVLGIAAEGFTGAWTVAAGAAGFIFMVVSGIILGLVAAGLLTMSLRWCRDLQFVAATLLIIQAHLVFIIGELVNHQEWAIGPVDIRVSSIIATTVSSLFLGNYARHSLTPRTDAYVDRSVGHLAFIVNSLVFVLAGLLFASIEVRLGDLWAALVISVLVVAGMRLVSVFAVTETVNRLRIDSGVPRAWQWLLSWGSLRGALAIIVVVGIPQDLQIPGWSLQTSPRDFLIALVVSCILVTLFIKAPLIAPLMRRLGADRLDPVELARRTDVATYFLLAERSGFSHSETRTVLHDDRVQRVLAELDTAQEEVAFEREELRAAHGDEVFERALRLTALGIEINALKQLYLNGEVSEITYRRLLGKLQLQAEAIEASDLERIDPHLARDRKDIFDSMVHAVARVTAAGERASTTVELLESARAQLILARRVVRVLTSMQREFATPVFVEPAFSRVIDVYAAYDAQCTATLDELSAQHSVETAKSLGRLTELSRSGWGLRAVALLQARGVAGDDDEDWLTDRYA